MTTEKVNTANSNALREDMLIKNIRFVSKKSINRKLKLWSNISNIRICYNKLEDRMVLEKIIFFFLNP